MTPQQCIEARALLGWSRAKLASEADVGPHVITAFEETGRIKGPLPRAPRVDRYVAICTALEAAGVEFTDGDAPGAKLRGHST